MNGEEFERYVAEDAERWRAVHARVTALMWLLVAVADGMERDAVIARFIRVKDLIQKLDIHPAGLAEVEDALMALDPKRASIGPSGERH